MKKKAVPVMIAVFLGAFCFVSCSAEKTETMTEDIENTKQGEESMEQMDEEELSDGTAEEGHMLIQGQEEKEAEDTLIQGQEEKETEHTLAQEQEEKPENKLPWQQEGTSSEKPEDDLEKSQQVTGDVDIDFEGMIDEIDREIEEQIDNSLPGQDFEK